MNRKIDSSQAILDAAEAVVAEAGAAHLTLDAVAAKADVSKGGLLYHFPSKEALLEGMLARLLDRVDQDRTDFHARIRGEPASDLQAYVLAGFKAQPDQRQVSAALLAAGANDPKLLDPVRAWQRNHFEEMARTKRNPSRAVAVMLALDGLWLNELLQTSPLSGKERKQLLEELLDLARSTV